MSDIKDGSMPKQEVMQLLTNFAPEDQRTGYDWVSIPIQMYPDNTPLIPTTDDMNPGLDHNFYWRPILLRPRVFQDFIAAMFWFDAFRERHGRDFELKLFLPFVPGARQDRLNDKGDYLFTAKSVAKMINQHNFKKVVVIDPHSEVICGLINNCMAYKMERLCQYKAFIEAFTAVKYDAVIAPDAGAEKRAGAVATFLKVPLIHAWKKRDVTNGNLCGFGHEEIPSNYERVLIVDDICDGGGTFVGLRETLSKDLHVDLYTTHGLYTKGTKHLTSVFDRVMCTDSVPLWQPADKNITVIEICETLSYHI